MSYIASDDGRIFMAVLKLSLNIVVYISMLIETPMR